MSDVEIKNPNKYEPEYFVLNQPRYGINKSRLLCNALLHVTILFIILSCLFMYYISKVTTTYINNILISQMKKYFNEMVYTSNNQPVFPTLKATGLNSYITNNITETVITYLQNEIETQIRNDPTIQSLNSVNNNLTTQLIEASDLAVQQTIQNNIDTVNLQINMNVKNFISNFDFDYYIKIFKQKDAYRDMINKNLFLNIKIVIIILVLFFIIILMIFIANKKMNMAEVFELFLENIVTFIFVGLIEFWFFTNIVTKYVPIETSKLYTSFLSSLSKLIKTNT